VRQNLPPGFSTRKISAAIARGLGTCSIHSQLTTQSKLLSGNFKDWASPTRNWTDAGVAEVRRFAISMAVAEKSITVTRTFGAVLANERIPHARSRPRGPHRLTASEFFNYRRVPRKPKGVATAPTHLFMPLVIFRHNITAHNWRIHVHTVSCRRTPEAANKSR